MPWYRNDEYTYPFLAASAAAIVDAGGKVADLVVLKKNPLDDIHNTTAIRFVMKNGELFDGESLDELWPEQKPLGKFWWAPDHP